MCSVNQRERGLDIHGLMLPKRYNAVKTEEKWQEKWKNKSFYKFSFKEGKRRVFVIDTPPPFTSGELHIGRAYACIISDAIARYKRMKGYNVLLPQGWDTQGLPTELAVEKRYETGSREEFIEKCKEWTLKAIGKMKKAMLRLGYSADWDFEYKTMDPDYHRKIQLSLIEMFEKGLIYRDKFPVHWCPKCQTALAQAEIGYVERGGYLTFIKFKVEDEFLVVATTRPELLHACVALAVNPEDDRYKKFIGKKACIPLFNREVPILVDEEVDMEFGTGVVMICTFGDEQDIKWVQRHSLPVVKSLDERGRLVNSGKYNGLEIEDARDKIIEDLKAQGYLEEKRSISHKVLVHSERSTCRKPVEFLVTWQWLIKTKPFRDMVKAKASKMKWMPPESINKLYAWVDSLEWDWVISRQRVFGTPIPFWVCEECGAIIAPKKEDLPVYPASQPPPIQKCPKCGSNKIEGVKDVNDCWVDSSITPLVISGWPDNESLFRKTYPSNVRQQGSEIIRTWGFYTILRSTILTGKPPFRELVVNGMIFGPDGKAMSSSLGNVIMPEEVIGRYGADSLRQALLVYAIGSDFSFQWKDVEYSSRFMQKLWNAFRFIYPHLKELKPEDKSKLKLTDLDRCFLSRLQTMVEMSTDNYEKYRFDVFLKRARKFVWEEFCDEYLELVKPRIYSENRGNRKLSAIYTLQETILTIIKLFAPITPHFSEEIYSYTLNEDRSVHEEKWPKPNPELKDETLEEAWYMIMELTRAVRKHKSESGVPLKEKKGEVLVKVPHKYFKLMEGCKEDIEKSLWIENLKTEAWEKENLEISFIG